jgi:uncharacterized protein (TIGR03437 family)
MPIRPIAPLLAACGLLLAATVAADGQAPSFVAAGVVNAATGDAILAPYTICTIYGTSLYLNGSAVASGHVDIPNSLAGVSVLLGMVPAGVLYVSENQINFLMPNLLTPGSLTIRVVRDRLSSPAIPIAIQETSPGLFASADGVAAATHSDGRPLTTDSPALPGEIIVLYATGFGRTVPDPVNLSIATAAAPIVHMGDFQIAFDGVPVDFARIGYAGLTPGNAGLYQVNVQLPDDVGENPEVRVSVAGVVSRAGIRIPVRP